MYHIGIRPEDYALIVCKGVNSPVAAYQAIMAKDRANPSNTSGVVFANTAGMTTADLSTFNYLRRRSALYPFDMECKYEPLSNAVLAEAEAELISARL